MAAADKVSGAYWRKRAIELAEKQKQEDDDLCLRFHREYERILHELDKELSIFYGRYAANESVSMADARRLLRDAELEDFRIGSRSLGRGCRSSSQSAERHVKTEGEFLKLGAADIGRTVVSPGGQGVGLFHRKSGGSRTTYRTRVNVSVTEIGWCWKGADHRILLWL